MQRSGKTNKGRLTKALSSPLPALFPAPSRRIPRAAWIRMAMPLVVFGAIYGGAVFYLTSMRMVHFAEPHAFWLLLVLPWIWWMQVAGAGRHDRMRGVVALVVRLAIVGLFAGLMARPQAVRESDRLAVVYAVDLSDSVGEESVRRALDYVVRTVNEKPERDAAGLVVFGREAGVELPPLESFPFEAINVQVPRDGTNLEKGLRLAAALCPEDRPGRIVLISDGTATGGSVERLLDELKAREVAVDVVPISYDFQNEVWVERIDLPERVKRGETYEAAVIVSALAAGKGKIRLAENGKVVTTFDAKWSAGKNRIVVPIYMRTPGYYDYEATVIPEKGADGWRENNVALGGLHLAGEGRILLVTDPAGEASDYTSILRALRESGREVDVKAAVDVPSDAVQLLPYHAIALVNTPAEELLPQQMQAMRDAVFHYGTGFLMVGGENSFGAGGYQRTDIEELLPVSMEIKQRRVMPKGAMAIILHTCEFASGNTWGKRITKTALSILSRQDEVGVLAYDWVDRNSWIVPFGPVGEYERMIPMINNADIGDMPGFDPTMQRAYAKLSASDAATKHMIIISDGDPSPPAPGLLKKFAADRISISTVAVFPHGASDLKLMRNIARVTGGRYYYPQKPSELPKIFIKEAKTLKRNLIINTTVTPESGFPSSILKGIDTIPPLHGFVLTTPKPRSELILGAEMDDVVEPILVAWRFGVGRTAAFTSDLAPRWGRDWLSWGHYRGFVDQLVGNVARVDRPTALTVRTVADEGVGVVTVVDSAPSGASLDVRASIRGPSGRVERIDLEQTGPRLYRGTFPLAGRGRYQVNVAGFGGARSERAIATLALAYSSEYLRFRADPIELKRIAKRTDGRVLTGEEKGAELFPEDRPVKRDARPVFDWLLLFLACLVPLDVAVRRVQVSFRSWFTRAERRSGETLEALMKRKDQIRVRPTEAERPARPGAARAIGEGAVRPESSAAPPSPKTPSKGDAPSGLEGLSTTERLLELKRKRQRDGDGDGDGDGD